MSEAPESEAIKSDGYGGIYKGIVLYTLPVTPSPSAIKPAITQSAFETLILGLPLEERVELHADSPLRRLALHYRLNFDDYFSREELINFIRDKGIKSDATLRVKYPLIGDLAISMGIIDRFMTGKWQERYGGAVSERCYEEPVVPRKISLKNLGGKGLIRPEVDTTSIT